MKALLHVFGLAVFIWLSTLIMPARNFAAIQSSNASLGLKSPVAIVVGATVGIGAAIAIKIAQYSESPQIHIVGRNQVAAESVLEELKKANPRGTYVFHKCDLALISNIQTLSSALLQAVPKINYLVLSTGVLNPDGRNENIEGNDLKMMVKYYARAMLIRDLLPSLEAAASSGEDVRVMSVNGKSGDLNKLLWDDLDLKKHFSLANVKIHVQTMTDVIIQRWAKMYPDIGFIHAYPGWVDTAQSVRYNYPWYVATPMNLLLKFGMSPSESGDWLFGALTSKAYSSGAHCVDEHGEAVIKAMSTEDQQKRVWDHTDEVLNHVN